MKYKVGDKVRISQNLYFNIMIKAGDVVKIVNSTKIDETEYYYVDKLPDVGFSETFISHLIISEITDELIDRFKEEKIVWHFKSKEDFMKTIDILAKKGIYGNSVLTSGRAYFDEIAVIFDEKIRALNFSEINFYKKRDYEIIEIMNPVYVSTLPCGSYETTNVWVETNDGKRLTKPMYKGIECEEMYQQYLKKKNIQEYLKKRNIQDLENKVENQKVEIKNLHNKINELQNTLTFEMDFGKSVSKENAELRQRNENQKFVIENYIEILKDIRDRLDEALDED